PLHHAVHFERSRGERKPLGEVVACLNCVLGLHERSPRGSWAMLAHAATLASRPRWIIGDTGIGSMRPAHESLLFATVTERTLSAEVAGRRKPYRHRSVHQGCSGRRIHRGRGSTADVSARRQPARHRAGEAAGRAALAENYAPPQPDG